MTQMHYKVILSGSILSVSLISSGIFYPKRKIKLMDEEYQQLSKFLAEAIKEREAYERQLNSPFGEHPKDEFLQSIQGVESNFGKNTNHKTMESGIHEGEAALGKYGLMPNTIRELAVKVSNPETKLGGSLPYKTNLKDVAGLKDADTETIQRSIASIPSMEDKIGRLLAEDVFLKSKNDEAAAYRWNQGHNIPKGTLDPEQVESSDYVQKYKKIRETLRK